MISAGDEPIPGYRCEKLLGRGQFGEVWKASSPGRTAIALKFLDLSNKYGWKEFRSVQRVKEIRHAHLLPIIAIWLLDADGRVLSDTVLDSLHQSNVGDTEKFAQETLVASATPTFGVKPARMIIATLLADKSLNDRLKECTEDGKRGVPVKELLGYMDEAAKGIDYLNSFKPLSEDSHVGVQHCDIKPDNIMLTGGSVAIADFGVAQIVAAQNLQATATSMGGSPVYMAPECFQRQPSRTSDQYALAVTYYELRTGKVPFAKLDFASVYEAHRTRSLDFSRVSEAEQSVLKRATSIDSTERFASCAEFANALRDATHPEVLAPPLPTPKPSGNRSTTAAIVVGLSAVLAVATAIGFFAGGPQPVDAVSLTLLVTPPDAELKLANERIEVTNGKAVISVPQAASVVLNATREGYDPAELRIGAEEAVEEKTFRLELLLSSSSLEKNAEQALQRGQFDKAIEAYTNLIERNPDRYAVVPSPQTVEAMHQVSCLEIAPGRRLVAGGGDGEVHSWKFEPRGLNRNPEFRHQHENGGGILDLAVSGGWVLSSSYLSEILLTHQNGEQRRLEDFGKHSIVEAVIAEERWLFVALEPVAQGPTAEVEVFTWDLDAKSNTEFQSSKRSLGPQPGRLTAIAAADHSPWIVVATTHEQESLVWRWGAGRQGPANRYRVPLSEIQSLAVAPDDNLFLSAGKFNRSTDRYDEYKATLTSVGRRNQSTTLPRGHADEITYSAFGAEGGALVTASMDGDAQVWSSIDLGELRASVPTYLQRDFANGRRHGVMSVAFGGEHGAIATSYSDGVIMLWGPRENSVSGIEVANLNQRLSNLVVSEDGRWLIVGGQAGRIFCWDLDELMMIKTACDRCNTKPRVLSKPRKPVT